MLVCFGTTSGAYGYNDGQGDKHRDARLELVYRNPYAMHGKLVAASCVYIVGTFLVAGACASPPAACQDAPHMPNLFTLRVHRSAGVAAMLLLFYVFGVGAFTVFLGAYQCRVCPPCVRECSLWLTRLPLCPHYDAGVCRFYVSVSSA